MNLVEPIRNKKDIKKIIDYLNKNHYTTSVIFQTGLYSGLRVSDILGLNIKDVENKDNIIVREKKTGKYKKFPIKDNLKIILNQYLEVRKKEWCSDRDEPLFIGKKRCRYHRSQVYRFINEACDYLGIEGDFGTHTIRKTFGYHHYKQFQDVVLLQKIFNHSSPAITLRYIGITQETIDDSYNAFGYHYDEEKTENIKNKNEIKKGNYKEIQNSLDNLFNLYKKLDKISYNSADNKIIDKIKNYLNNGGIKHRDFCLMLLSKEEVV